jgi:hypothetical protein
LVSICPASTRCSRVCLDFSAPCHAGEQLTVAGEVVFLSDAFRRFEIKAGIRKADRKLVSKALIRVGFRDRSND